MVLNNPMVVGDAPSYAPRQDAKTQRLHTVHTLRGLAAFGVVWYHFAYLNGLKPWLGVTGKHGNLGVPVFFVISGFILPYSLWKGHYRLSDYGRFVAKRVIRLDPPYLVAILLAVIIGYATGAPSYSGAGPFAVTPMQLLLHLGFLNVFAGNQWVIGVLWTLAIEFHFYLTLGLTYYLLASEQEWKFLLFVAGCAVSQYLAFNIRYLPYHWPLFLLGIAAFRHKAGYMTTRKALLYLLVFFSYCEVTLGLATAIAGGGAALSIMFLTLRSQITNFLGDISYSLYLIHQPIGRPICNLGALFVTTRPQAALVAAFATVVVIAAAYLMYRWIELPSQRFAGRIRYRAELGASSAEARASSKPPRRDDSCTSTREPDAGYPVPGALD